MAFNSTSDNLLSNIVDNTNSLDKGDFPSVVNTLVKCDGAGNVDLKSIEQFKLSGATVFQGTYFPIKEWVYYTKETTITDGKHLVDLENSLQTFIDNMAFDYLAISGGVAAWIVIKKIESIYFVSPTAGDNATSTIKITADIYNEV